MADLKMKPLPVGLGAFERTKLKTIAKAWGTSLGGAIRRLIREYEIKPEKKGTK